MKKLIMTLGVSFFCLNCAHVRAEIAVGTEIVSPPLAMPLSLYSDCVDGVPDADSAYISSGWMGNWNDLERDECWSENPHSGKTCIKINYSAYNQWVGIAWLHPAGDWGDEPGGHNLQNAKHLTFWARGEHGGEVVDFKLGILPSKKDYPDSGKAGLGKVKLSTVWQKYVIPLDGKDLTNIKSGFVWSMAGKKDAYITFYLDDIQYE